MTGQTQQIRETNALVYFSCYNVPAAIRDEIVSKLNIEGKSKGGFWKVFRKRSKEARMWERPLNHDLIQ
jgi:hypothetical protein